MKELEEVSCEIRRIVDLQISVSDRLSNLEEDDHGLPLNTRRFNNTDNYLGGFLSNATYAWLSYGCHLVVIKVKSGESISSWKFRERVSCVSEFPVRPGDVPLLLVGLDSGAGKVKDSVGFLCIFDCTTSRVLRAIKVPVGIEQVCIISGGAEWEEFSDKRPESVINEMDGTACVALRNLDHIMIDLQRPSWNGPDCLHVMDETAPAEIDLSSSKHRPSSGRHTAYQLMNNRIEKHIGFDKGKFEATNFYSEKLTSTLISSTKIGCLISGCLGRVIIWQNNGSVGWISPTLDDTMIVTHLALLEPTDDPRPFYYLWIVYQDESCSTAPVIRMYALLFERKYCEKGTNLYFNLEAEPSLKFELEMDDGDKIISLSTIERGISPEQTDTVFKRGEDNLLLISTTERTYLFDLNQWYKEQMPRTICECQNPNSILASYNTKTEVQNKLESNVISCSYISSTLRDFPNNCPTSVEELFYPNSLSFEWVELSTTKLTFWMTRGIQAELLREMATAGPMILLQPSETFHKCLSVGLVPFKTDFSTTSDINAQREMLLSLCLEQRWTMFLVQCAKEWSDGSASYLYPTFLKWGIQRASSIKAIADRLCVPLFDQSGNNIGESEVKILRFCSQQLDCLSAVVNQITLDGCDLIKQRKALKMISMYLQVLLWFYDVGLLPEVQEYDETVRPMHLSLQIPYPVETLTSSYKAKREQLKRNINGNYESEGLFIDELIAHECPMLKAQWERESTETNTSGCYPPPSLQSLLRSFLTDCNLSESDELACKHQITVYLLMDLTMLLQGVDLPGIDQLMKYPSAFKMNPSLIKLTQAFWLLDHEDYQRFMDTMTGQLISNSDIKEWHHKLILRTLVQNDQHKLALMYLRIRKPPLSSVQDQSTVISLSVEHGLVQSAFHNRPPSLYAQLLNCFFQACKNYGKLTDILHLSLDSEEEEIFVKFLEEEKFKDIRLLYYLQRCRYTEAGNGSLSNRYKNTIQKNIQPASLTMLNAYNATLPNVTKRFSINMARTSMESDLEPRYPRPMSHYKSNNKVHDIHETVIKKAKETFIRAERYQIPFISAPCSSLLKVGDNTNANCAMFPSLPHAIHGKRSVEQVYENGEAAIGTPEGKRRKLSDNDVTDATNSKDLGLNIQLETPLVQRKRRISRDKDVPPGTPQSILKIRQATSSTDLSPNISTLSGNTENLTVEKEKKVNRQIRFSINQSKRHSTQKNPENNKEDKNTGNLDEDNLNTSLESDVFFSPNTSGQSQTKSMSSDSSVISNRQISGPRPRPSLRRSLQNSRESSVESISRISNEISPTSSSPDNCQNTSTNFVDTNKSPSTVIPPRTPKSRASLLSKSIYSPAVLLPDSSFERTVLDRDIDDMTTLCWLKPQAQSTFCTRSRSVLSILQNVGDNHITHEKIETEEITYSESYPKTSKEGDEVSELQHSQKSPPIETEFNRTLEDKLTTIEKSCLQENSRMEYDSQNTEQNEVCEQQEVNTSEKSNEKLYLKDDDDDVEDDDNNDAFESMNNSLEDNKQVSQVCSESWTKNHKSYSNGVQQSIKSTVTQVDITDDESSDSVEPIKLVLDEADNEEHKTNSVPTLPNNTCNDPSITDDESNDSSISSSVCKITNIEKSTRYSNRTLYNIEEDSSKQNKNVSDSNDTNKSTNEVSQIGKTSTTTLKNLVEDKKGTPKKLQKQAEVETAPVRSTRSRRSSSVAKDAVAINTENLSQSSVRRTRRASSLAKELLSTSIQIADENINKTSVEVENLLDVPEKNLRRRSLSVQDISTTQINFETAFKSQSRTTEKDIDNKVLGELEQSRTPRKNLRHRSASVQDVSSTQPDNIETEANVQPKRSKRRATSVQKEIPEQSISQKSPAKRIRKSSASSIISEDDNEGQLVRRSTRAKRSSTKESEATTSVEKTNIRKQKRDGSEPKEIKSTMRTRRSSSVGKEVSNQTVSELNESKRGKRTTVNPIEPAVSSPAANTRSRRSSIQSIPEELEEILSVPSKERKSTRTNTTDGQNPRQRRAASVDLQLKPKRKMTRSYSTRSVLNDAIVEEPTELEEPKDTNIRISPTGRVTRRRKVESSSSVEKGSKTSKKDTKNQFAFSEPEMMDSQQVDQKAIGHVPNYVFSPPHTRSKNVPTQHPREVNPSTSISDNEEASNEVIRTTSQSDTQSSNHVRIRMRTYNYMEKFLIPKRSKSTKD